MSRIARCSAALGLVSLVMAASAMEPPPATVSAPAVSAGAFGSETRAWVDLQASGTQAAEGLRPMPGEIADHVYQRYLDSFKQPIPAEFKRQSAAASGNGSGQ